MIYPTQKQIELANRLGIIFDPATTDRKTLSLLIRRGLQAEGKRQSIPGLGSSMTLTDRERTNRGYEDDGE